MNLVQYKWQNVFDKIDDLGEGGNAKVYLVKNTSVIGDSFYRTLFQQQYYEQKCLELFGRLID